MTDLPARRFDRAQLERILLRAAELQATDRELADGLTPDEVLALAKEVGIPEAHVRRALVEERHQVTPLPPPSGLDAFAGRGELLASRIVPGEPAAVQQELLRFFEKHESLAVQRMTPGRVTWERLGGLRGALKRGSAALDGSRTFMLDNATEVSAEIASVEAGWSQVSLRADARAARTSWLAGAASLGVSGLVGGGILLVLNAPEAVAVLPPLLLNGAGIATARAFRARAQRIQLGLERALDHLEHHRTTEALPRGRDGLLETFVNEVRRAIT